MNVPLDEPGQRADRDEPDEPGQRAERPELHRRQRRDHLHDRHRHERRRRTRRRRIVLGAVAVLVAVVVGFGVWYELQVRAFGGPGRKVVVTVSEGQDVTQVADDLASQGVISSTLAYRVYTTVHGAPTLRPGDYLLRQNSSFGAVTKTLAGEPDVGEVTVPPGITLREVAGFYGEMDLSQRSSASFVAATKEVSSPWEPAGSDDLEGLLGTGTYLVLPDESTTTVVRDMVQRFDHQATSAGLTPAVAARDGLTPNQLVTVASITEKEGYIQKNMGKVARVIYNRLAAGMPLQMDSTILYALGQDGGTVTEKDLQINSPYNTYLHTGLTPTPTCMPGPDALYAAAHPTPGAWLYFVLVSKNGTAAFADTYQEQLANQALAQKRGV